MGSRGAPAAPQMPPVSVTINTVGGAQLTPDKVREIRGHVASGVADGHAQIQRNCPQSQSGSRQY